MGSLVKKFLIVVLTVISVFSGCIGTQSALAANPYLPVWEHVPDGEPRVFTYNGETRVYIYGSHDTIRTQYCGFDYVVWSAPADDLTKWRYDGVCFRSRDGQNMYAPDVVEKDGMFYMYVAGSSGGKIYVAKSKTPYGPFADPVRTDLGFDPAVLVDDDGRVYAYWGFKKTIGAELNADMATIKTGTKVEDFIANCNDPPNNFNFFEASSIRKMGDKYIFVYSKKVTNDPNLGLSGEGISSTGFLAYAYSSSPLSGFVYGGIISCNAGEIIQNSSGVKSRAYPTGNNHGSIARVGEQWYVFYHRQTGTSDKFRQGMLEPIEVATGTNGKVYIGKIEYDLDNNPISSGEVEMTSQGASTEGIDAYTYTTAGYTCYLTKSEKDVQPYIQPVYKILPDTSSPVVKIQSGANSGFKYIQFGEYSPSLLEVKLKPLGIPGTVTVLADSPTGAIIGTINLSSDLAQEFNTFSIPLAIQLTGKHALYFNFTSSVKDANICEFDGFKFTR